jgi:hypothetical protein
VRIFFKAMIFTMLFSQADAQYYEKKAQYKFEAESALVGAGFLSVTVADILFEPQRFNNRRVYIKDCNFYGASISDAIVFCSPSPEKLRKDESIVIELKVMNPEGRTRIVRDCAYDHSVFPECRNDALAGTLRVFSGDDSTLRVIEKTYAIGD